MYDEVVKDFKDRGFTNVKTEKIDDLIAGWITKDGEVEKVTVGGDEKYSPDKWVAADIEVIVYYHTFPEKQRETTETDIKSSEDDSDTGVESEAVIPPIIASGMKSAVKEGKKHIDKDFATNYKMAYYVSSDETGYQGSNKPIGDYTSVAMLYEPVTDKSKSSYWFTFFVLPEYWTEDYDDGDEERILYIIEDHDYAGDEVFDHEYDD